MSIILPRAARPVAAALALLLFVSARSAHADISFADMFRDISYQQTGDGAMLTLNGAFFTTHLTSTTDNEFTAVTMTYPGPGSPQALAQTMPTVFTYQSTLLPDQATMDAAYPMGTYSYSATTAGGTLTTSYSYASDDYPQSLPYLTGAGYSSLQNVNPA